MADETKRVIDQATDTSLSAGDYVIVDSESEGTRKFDLGTELTGIKQDLAELEGGGLTEDAKQALLQLAQKVAYIDDDGQTYYQDLYDALYPPAPPATLTSITCVYTQSGTVYDTDTLDSLKSDLVVTAHYDNSTSQVVTTYTLSGTLTEGTSTITVTYGGKTTTFNVTVTHNAQEWTDGVPYSFEWVENKYISNTTGQESNYNGWNASPYLNCAGAGHLLIHNGFKSSSGYNGWYDENQTYIDKFTVSSQSASGATTSITVPSNAVYFRVSYDTSGTGGDKTYTITPTAS